MPTKYLIKPSEYHDSITLMETARELTQLPGVTDAAVVMATDDAGVMTDLVLELTLSGEVLEEVVSCIPYGCVSAMASYHHEKSLSLSLRGLSSTVVTIESFEEGTAITTTTLEHITAPLEQ